MGCECCRRRGGAPARWCEARGAAGVGRSVAEHGVGGSLVGMAERHGMAPPGEASAPPAASAYPARSIPDDYTERATELVVEDLDLDLDLDDDGDGDGDGDEAEVVAGHDLGGAAAASAEGGDGRPVFPKNYIFLVSAESWIVLAWCWWRSRAILRGTT